MYNIHRGWRRRVRLKKLAAYIQLMDKAIESEGGPDKLNNRQLQWVHSLFTLIFIYKLLGREFNPSSVSVFMVLRILNLY